MKRKYLIFAIFETIFGYVIIASLLTVFAFYSEVFNSNQPVKVISSYVFNLNSVNITLFMSIALVVVVVNMTHGAGNLNQIKNESTGDKQHGSSRFATREEKEHYYKLVKQGHEDTNGVILGYDKHKNYYVDTSDKNILVYAPPGSGKTQSIIINNILYNIKVYENTGKWSNQVIVSLKNDLHDMTISEMQKNDIEVSVINLRNPLMSKKFNPMKQVNDYIAKYNQATTDQEKTKAYARAEKYAKTLASAIVKSVGDASGGDQFFSQTSQGLISAIILLVSEYGKPEEKHLVSVFNLIIELNGLSEESTETLQKSRFKELLELAPDHRANYLAGASVSADVRTSMNVFASALSELLSFIDLEMEQMFQTSEDEFDLHQFVTTKSAVYLIVPDEDTSKHFIASLFYRLLFDMSIAVAENECDGKLPYNILNFHDEFGQFPAIKDYDGVVQAVRSRGIKNITILQNIHQLKNRYGDKKADNIVASFQITMNSALPATDDEWRKKTSERLGTKTIKTGNVNFGNSSKTMSPTTNQSRSTTYSMMKRELLTPDELIRLPIGIWLVIETGKYPCKMKMILAKELFNIQLKNDFKENPIVEIKTLNYEKLKQTLSKEYMMKQNQQLKNSIKTDNQAIEVELEKEQVKKYNLKLSELFNYMDANNIEYDEDEVKLKTLDDSGIDELINCYFKNSQYDIVTKRKLKKLLIELQGI